MYWKEDDGSSYCVINGYYTRSWRAHKSENKIALLERSTRCGENIMLERVIIQQIIEHVLGF